MQDRVAYTCPSNTPTHSRSGGGSGELDALGTPHSAVPRVWKAAFPTDLRIVDSDALDHLQTRLPDNRAEGCPLNRGVDTTISTRSNSLAHHDEHFP
eukprot:m.495616 g.495616  ORF g.495616 m.495616 type:complete len:97 (-) comp139947_c0_seq1:58-348(-)